MIIQTIASVFIIIGVVLLFNFTPQQMTDDILKITTSKMTVRKKVEALRSGKGKRSIGQRLKYIKTSLDAMGKEKLFGIIVALSFALFGGGAVLAVMINNPFLIPALGVGLAIIPFVYVRSSLQTYKKHINEELETTLSIITTSYLRSEDIITAVKENVEYIKPPMHEHFMAFLSDATYVTNTEQALINLKTKIDNSVFQEWVEALLQCQSDRVLKDTLQPIVTRLTDVRIVNGEIQAMLASCKMEYYTMVAMTLGNIPLLYALNKDWYTTLMTSTPGKITLGIIGLVIVYTYLRLLKYTQPIEYKA